MTCSIESYFDLSDEIREKETIINVFDILARPTKDLYVINCGFDNMFVTVYQHTDKNIKRLYPSEQVWIYPNTSICFHNVHKLLIDKIPKGNKYRVTEFQLYRNKTYGWPKR